MQVTVLHLVRGSKLRGILKMGRASGLVATFPLPAPKPGFECYSLSAEPHHSLGVPDLFASYMSPVMTQKVGEFRMCFPFQPAAAAKPSGLQAYKLVGILIDGGKPEPGLDGIP